ncbi:unknown [Coprobacillus sp. CAG:605]|nr:unknown [Coprobacillus sp. CAG:605]
MSLKSSVVGKTISMDEILQMYVYIPRYRYKLFNANNGTSKEHAIDIIFEKVSTEKSNGTENGEWLTHPAFTFGNTKLPGIWVGKFEASGLTDNYQIKPNQKSMTQLNLSEMFNTSRTVTTTMASTYETSSSTSDSHMIKKH